LGKGMFFSIETMYLLVAVFAVIIGLIHFLPAVEQPDYDLISALKVAHDMGQNNTSLPPKTYTNTNFDFGQTCNDGPGPSGRLTAAIISYYDYGTGPADKRVCPK